MSAETYTLKQLVARLAPKASPKEAAQLMRRIRHWTAANLLQPIGGKDTGTGVSRRYDERELQRAAILAELERYRVPVPIIDQFPLSMDNYQSSQAWRDALEGKRPVFLQLAWNEMTTMWTLTPDIPQVLLLAPKGKVHSHADALNECVSAIVVNLTGVFAKLHG